MKKVFYLLICILFFNSCYVYKPIEGKEEAASVSVKQQMQPGRIYKFDVDQKTYVVKVVGWEKDSLIAQTNFKKDIKQNFAENKIKNVRTKEFSDTRSNFLTVITYVAIATGVIFLLK